MVGIFTEDLMTKNLFGAISIGVFVGADLEPGWKLSCGTLIWQPAPDQRIGTG
jgi:hypothetical protein